VCVTLADGGSGVASAWADGGGLVHDGLLSGGVLSIPTTLLAEGPTTLIVTAVDVAGNTSTAAVDFTLDRTPPVTTSDAAAAYVGTATIALSATDTASGVAHTYWRLDGGVSHVGTSVVVPDPLTGSAMHALAFWSVDAVGNVEASTSAAFSVAAPPPTVYATKLTVKGKPNTKLRRSYKLAGTITPSAAGGTVKITLSLLVNGKWRSEGVAYARLSAGTFAYTFKPKHKGRWGVIAVYAGQSLPRAVYRASRATASFRVR
jgi:hypothetical protein